MSQSKMIRRLVDVAREGRLSGVLAFLQQGLDPNLGDHRGETALFGAACMGHSEIIKALADQGAQIDLANKAGETPLMRAVDAGHLRASRLLLELGAAVDATDGEGLTPLMHAANASSASCVRLLLKHRAQVNARSSIGATALIYAVFAGCAGFLDAKKDATVKALLEAGADPTLQDAEGASALSIARDHEAADYVELLENPARGEGRDEGSGHGT